MDIQITKNNLTNLMDTFNQKQLNQIIDVLQKEHSKMNIFIDDLRRSETFKKTNFIYNFYFYKII